MTRAILLLLLLIFVVRAVWRLLEGIVSGASQPEPRARRRSEAPGVKLVQDPVCGTFVVPGKAASLVRAGQTIYFCSDACRDKYAAG